MVEINQEVPVTGIPVFRQLETVMQVTEAIVEVTMDVEVVTAAVAAEMVAAIKSSSPFNKQ